jgi:hypothetical protein
VKPFLRPTSRARLAPVGWKSEPAGQWAGREVEVVYDPRQHQVVLCRNDPGDHTRAELSGAGYRRCASDGTQEMWVRDRGAAAGAALEHEAGPQQPQHQEHQHRRPAAGIEGLGL